MNGNLRQYFNDVLFEVIENRNDFRDCHIRLHEQNLPVRDIRIWLDLPVGVTLAAALKRSMII